MVYSGGRRFPYESGGLYDFRGKLVENPNPRIIDALDEAFYLAFGNIEPTGKVHLLGLDISSSMSGQACGIPGLSCALGAAAMAMVTARSGDPYMVRGFSTDLRDLGISANMRLDDVLARTARQNFGGTDCSLPMQWADSQGMNVDVFCVYTDNETWAGRPHPSQALKNYRKSHNPQAKLAVIGMAANEFSIADPNDAGMMDFVGFDSAAPQILSDFARGNL
jgi:60 kDa SS-A/Ro ribonucleoprotein